MPAGPVCVLPLRLQAGTGWLLLFRTRAREEKAICGPLATVLCFCEQRGLPVPQTPPWARAAVRERGWALGAPRSLAHLVQEHLGREVS